MPPFRNPNNAMMNILQNGDPDNDGDYDVSSDTDNDSTSDSMKMTPVEAGYLELDGATQDASCEIVDGSISSDRGCCNAFRPQQGAQVFSCGTCAHVSQGGGDNEAPTSSASDDESAAPSPEMYS